MRPLLLIILQIRTKDYKEYNTTTPTKAGGTVLLNAKAVLYPISAAVTLALSGFYDPGVTIFGFNNAPSKKTLFYANALKTADRTLSVT